MPWIFGERVVFRALMKNKRVRRLIAGSRPISLRNLLAKLGGRCTPNPPEKMLQGFAFFGTDDNLVHVRMGLQGDCTQARKTLSLIDISLPISSRIRRPLKRARKDRLMMRKLERRRRR